MEKQKEIKKTRAFKNNLYAVKLLWGIKKSAVVHTAFSQTGYFVWVFYSLFFIRYLIGAIEQSKSFLEIVQFILFTGGCFSVYSAYIAYVEGTFNPMASITVYQKLYRMLYKKAMNVELRCFEDSNFYNKYTLAIDKAEERLQSVVSNLFGIFFGGTAAIIVFTTMYSIDRVAMLFVIFPIIGNFVFGYIMNKMFFRRDQAMAPYKRRIDYVNRVMHLADYSKEMRLSNVYNLMKQKYIEALNGIFDVVEQYVFKINLPLWFRNYFTFTIIFEGVLLYGAFRTIVSKSMSLSELAVLSSAMVSATWILLPNISWKA